MKTGDIPAPRAVIAEDEPRLREQLAERLAALWPELEIAASVGDGVDALHALERLRPDVLFLDIQMPRMSGLDVARHASSRCHVAFLTAYEEYAVAAFDQGAVDYILKPLSASRLATTVARLKERMQSHPADLGMLLQRLAATSRPDEYLHWITASVGKTVKLITVEEICYFRADNKYTAVVTADAEYLITKPIKELCEELDPRMFWQIHRSTLVNVNAIASVDRSVRRVMLNLKLREEALPVSEAFAHRFHQM